MDNDIDRLDKCMDKLFERGSVLVFLLICIAGAIELVKTLLTPFLPKGNMIFFTIDITFLVLMLVDVIILISILIKFMLYLIKRDKLEEEEEK